MTMKIKSIKNTEAPTWLTEELQQKVRKVFEPKYNRPLSNSEVITIALQHTQFMEHFFQFKWRLTYGTNK